MGTRQTRQDAVTAIIAICRSAYATAAPASVVISDAIASVVTIAGNVSTNTISAQQVTDLQTAAATLGGPSGSILTGSISQFDLIVQNYNAPLRAE